ncbi:MAG: T9SS type A sorting domain-containing protein, partial [Ignavibacteria bacterium]|nr:T9SS type A sorting domain-containing protein [Ignavibacteria bacterium]
VSLKVYDILGNLVTTLVDQEMDAGYYTVSWNAGNLASGVYIYRFVSDSFISSKKLILMK